MQEHTNLKEDTKDDECSVGGLRQGFFSTETGPVTAVTDVTSPD
jgi:hypothetical protein